MKNKKKVADELNMPVEHVFCCYLKNYRVIRVCGGYLVEGDCTKSTQHCLRLYKKGDEK